VSFKEEIAGFLSSLDRDWKRKVTPVPLTAVSYAEAVRIHDELSPEAGRTIFVTEDRWRSQTDAVKERLAAHFGHFTQVYARNCEVRRIDKATAAGFLTHCHSYGDALSRYRYGLFVSRTTGEKDVAGPFPALGKGTLVAVSEFSPLRHWTVDGELQRCCEWIRYASLPWVRVEGGMGKMLAHFIEEVRPDEMMTYADLEWSDGAAYRTLGFREIGGHEPIMFTVDPATWRRNPLRDPSAVPPGTLYYMNFGSIKYRLDCRVL